MSKDNLPSLNEYNKIYDGINKEEDIDKLKNLIDLFNVNIKKKEILRKQTLSQLQDKVLYQVQRRIENNPEEFTNKELNDFMKTFSDMLDRDATLIDDDINAIQLNSPQEVNININNEIKYLDKDSRHRIANAVSNILNSIKEPSEEDEESNIIDVPVTPRRPNRPRRVPKKLKE